MTAKKTTIAQYCDHTLLAPGVTESEIHAHVSEAHELGVYAVCVPPNHAAYTKTLVGADLKLAAVCGFPSGNHDLSVKLHEAEYLVKCGVDEIDWVLEWSRLKQGDEQQVFLELDKARSLTRGQAKLKVIIESAALTDEEIIRVCQIAKEVNVDMVKTSTGFATAGGASVAAIQLMAATVGPDIGVKASGGIRTLEQAQTMIVAGATRLGTSGTRQILSGEISSNIQNSSY